MKLKGIALISLLLLALVAFTQYSSFELAPSSYNNEQESSEKLS
ncbi:hypothetical protein [Pontibacillus halophilus]|nr:hypothetical protein [Pontibacillus halophilus]